MNKKGFSLVELLSVIVIIALVGGIAMISYSSYINKSRERIYKTYEDTMKSTVEMYLIDNMNLLPEIGNSSKIMLSTLLSQNEIEQIKNPIDSTDLCQEKSYVEITRSEDTTNNLNLNYKVCLICKDYQTSICTE